MAAGVYIITNEESGNVYIGSTADFRKRWRQHCYALRGDRHKNSHLQRAWDKYGEGAFEFAVLEYVDGSEELYLAEQEWMDGYREEGYELYNYSLSARCSRLGVPQTEEARRKIGEANKGHKHSEEARRKMGVNKGRSLTEEHKCKISEALKGRVVVISEETRRKISEALKGRPSPLVGYKHTEETRRRMSKAARESELHRDANAGSYPAFYNERIDTVIPAGVNLCALCREWGLDQSTMNKVARRQGRSHKGWILA